MKFESCRLLLKAGTSVIERLSSADEVFLLVLEGGLSFSGLLLGELERVFLFACPF